MLHLVALLVLGLMCGSELNVALFSHPVLKRQPQETHILVRSSLAALLGRVMPFWMAGSTLLNLLLILPFERLNESAWRLAAVAFAIQSSLPCFRSLLSYLSITGLPNGLRNPSQRTGMRRNIAGICIISSERVGFSWLLLSSPSVSVHVEWFRSPSARFLDNLAIVRTHSL
jgi:hypothetical protein